MSNFQNILSYRFPDDARQSLSPANTSAKGVSYIAILLRSALYLF